MNVESFHQPRSSELIPSIGNDVHHVTRGSADGRYPPDIRAAKIIRVGDDGTVSLIVWTEEGQFWHTEVAYHAGDPSPEPAFSPHYRCPHTGLAYPGRTWHWPPIVGPRT